MLVTFEAQPKGLDPIYTQIENFIRVQVVILVFDLIFFLYKEARRDSRGRRDILYATFWDRVKAGSCWDIFINTITLATYFF